MVKSNLWRIAKIVIALGVSLIAWTLIVGLQGLDGPSIVKENLWYGMSKSYANIIVSDTDGMGYGYAIRLSDTWNSVNNGVAYTDSRCVLQ